MEQEEYITLRKWYFHLKLSKLLKNPPPTPTPSSTPQTGGGTGGGGGGGSGGGAIKGQISKEEILENLKFESWPKKEQCRFLFRRIEKAYLLPPPLRDGLEEREREKGREEMWFCDDYFLLYFPPFLMGIVFMEQNVQLVIRKAIVLIKFVSAYKTKKLTPNNAGLLFLFLKN